MTIPPAESLGSSSESVPSPFEAGAPAGRIARWISATARQRNIIASEGMMPVRAKNESGLKTLCHSTPYSEMEGTLVSIVAKNPASELRDPPIPMIQPSARSALGVLFCSIGVYLNGSLRQRRTYRERLPWSFLAG